MSSCERRSQDVLLDHSPILAAFMTSTEKINHQNDIGNHHWRVHERTKLLENLGGNVDYRFGEIVLRSLANKMVVQMKGEYLLIQF